MDEILTIQIVEPVLIQVVGVGVAVEIMNGGVLHSILVTGILKGVRICVTMKDKDLPDIPPHCT